MSNNEIKDFNELAGQLASLLEELIALGKVEEHDILVVGCSTSEIIGKKIGTGSSEDLGQVLFKVLKKIADEHCLYLAIQCCEHLNRALVVDKKCMQSYNLRRVNAVPALHAGGSLSMAAFKGPDAFENPCLVESLVNQAKLGIDIGDTFIGMHMDKVTVPVRLKAKSLGEAHITACRVRCPYTGGPRAEYDDNLK